jgi:hypothetical protein
LTDAPQSAKLVAFADRIELWPIDHLRLYQRNRRTHSEVQVDQIAALMVEFGWTNPILIDENAVGLLGAAHPAAGVCSGRRPWSTFIVWAKHTFTLGRADYQSQYEPTLCGWKEGSDHYWSGARDQGDVWFFDKPARNDLHPTMKPVALVERAIRNSSKTRDIVLDPFGGSGPTLIACEKTGRQAR